MPHAYPLMLNVADRLIVIIGGGVVAVRKVKGLFDCGATRVRCVAPDIHGEMPKGVERIVARYDARYLDGATLVFAATNNPEVNATVVRDARARSILVNRADADETDPGDFASPARLRESDVTVAVSAAGNPALAVLIRDEIRENWDPRWSCMQEAMRTLRPLILARVVPEHRPEIFHALASAETLEVLAAGGEAGLRAWLGRRYPDLSDHA